MAGIELVQLLVGGSLNKFEGLNKMLRVHGRTEQIRIHFLNFIRRTAGANALSRLLLKESFVRKTLRGAGSLEQFTQVLV
jgi:hypothetical protein